MPEHMQWKPEGGYMGRILRVDLDKGTITEEKLDAQMVRDFVGGVGLASRILYGEVPPGTDPYDSANALVVTTGPLTGTLAPGSCNFNVGTKSPVTGMASGAQANGYFGPRLKYAGYDALVIKGASQEPVYLHIHNGKAELKDAKNLWGKDTIESDLFLRAEYGEKNIDQNLSVACIGPAGENLVRFAAIFNDFGHVCSKGGAGAVMGSKKLKAIVVHGDSNVPIVKKNKASFREWVKKWEESTTKSPLGGMYSKYGTAGVVSIFHTLGWLPVKNYTTSIFPEYERFDGKNLRTAFKTKPRSCHSCPLAHCHLIEVSEGPYKGLRCEEPEYELWAGWGPNIGNTDPNAVVKLNDLTDRLGMDGNEASYLVSMVMECFEKGIISSKDLSGVDLTWGNVSGAISLLESIALRKGIGDTLAEGIMRSATKIGKGAEECAIYVKRGGAPQGLDLRGAWGLLFTHAVSTIGSWEGYFLERGTIPEIGFKEPIPAWSEEWVPKAAAKTGCKRQFEESIGCCIFVSRESIQIYLNAINALTGFDLDVDKMLKIGKRIIALNRAFAIREGCTPEDDSASPRILNGAKDGPAMDRSIAPSLEAMKKAYYAEMGWDEITSKPLPETLRSLDLDFAIKDLW